MATRITEEEIRGIIKQTQEIIQEDLKINLNIYDTISTKRYIVLYSDFCTTMNTVTIIINYNEEINPVLSSSFDNAYICNSIHELIEVINFIINNPQIYEFTDVSEDLLDIF